MSFPFYAFQSIGWEKGIWNGMEITSFFRHVLYMSAVLTYAPNTSTIVARGLGCDAYSGDVIELMTGLHQTLTFSGNLRI